MLALCFLFPEHLHVISKPWNPKLPNTLIGPDPEVTQNKLPDTNKQEHNQHPINYSKEVTSMSLSDFFFSLSKEEERTHYPKEICEPQYEMD